jgi:hypothetical protein
MGWLDVTLAVFFIWVAIDLAVVGAIVSAKGHAAQQRSRSRA